MKKIIVSLLLACGSMAAFAQTASLDQFFDKYEGKPGFTTVNVSEKLFALAASATPADETEIKEIVDGMKGIKIIMFENSEGNAKAIEYYNEAKSMLPSGYEELLTVNSEGEKVVMLGKTTGESIINELIMLVLDDEQFVMIKIMGTIDMKNIAKISEMGMDQMDHHIDIQIDSDDNKEDK